MAWLPNLFAKSPFTPLIAHQRKAQECAEAVPALMAAALAEDYANVAILAKRTSTLEFEADALKTKVRDGLPKGIFMPVSRGDLLGVLEAQDEIADCAEDIGVLLTMRQMEAVPDEVATLITELVEASVRVVQKTTSVVERLDGLVKSSFSGPQVEKLLGLINLVDREEHAADKVQDQLAKAFFRHEDTFKPAAIVIWMKIFRKIGNLANNAERVTRRIRLFLAE